MRHRRTHSLICLIGIAAYLVNTLAAADGAILCQDPSGESSIEFAYDHDHCATALESLHDHDSKTCWCPWCPCEDIPLAIDVALLLKDDDGRGGGSASPTATVRHIETALRPVCHAVLDLRAPPTLDRSPRLLRTVVLLL